MRYYAVRFDADHPDHAYADKWLARTNLAALAPEAIGDQPHTFRTMRNAERAAIAHGMSCYTVAPYKPPMRAIMSPRFPKQRAHSCDMFRLFEKAGSKWPDAGMAARDIQGIRVWVNPIAREAGRKSSKHRVRCLCPTCGTEVSAGRLFMHVCKGKLK